MRDAESWFPARETEPDLLRARLILALSDRSACHDSVSDPELLPESTCISELAFCTVDKDERALAVVGLKTRLGDCSSSDESGVIRGGGGEPSDFLDKNPAWKRFDFALISNEL